MLRYDLDRTIEICIIVFKGTLKKLKDASDMNVVSHYHAQAIAQLHMLALSNMINTETFIKYNDEINELYKSKIK